MENELRQELSTENSCDGDDEQGDSSQPSSDPAAGYSSAYRFDAAQLGDYAKETTQAVPSEEVLSPQLYEEDKSAKGTSPQPQKNNSNCGNVSPACFLHGESANLCLSIVFRRT